MQIAVALSLIVCFIGLLLYGFVPGKLESIGKDMFWVGLLSFLLRFDYVVHLLGR